MTVRHLVGEISESELRLRAAQDGRTAHQEEASKRCRYPSSRHGVRLTPLVLETYGRLGKAALQYLRTLAKSHVARDPELQVGGAWAVPALLQRWVGILSITLQRANVEAVRSSIGVGSHAPRLGGQVPQPHELYAAGVYASCRLEPKRLLGLGLSLKGEREPSCLGKDAIGHLDRHD